eukprot:TRINITY_DN143_c0_g1_i1.p1 TRINITY_DN143_c0_g1~~TRINITY_DN143_c0_g1_i1.p1  ORF type:complete len:851 (+),score=191.95 TRINITY_DN143_c0_g1_i1:116-2668(+)
MSGFHYPVGKILFRTFTFLIILVALWYLVVSAYCEGFDWVGDSLNCPDGTTDDSSTSSGKGKGKYVLDADCYKSCTTSRFSIAYDILYTNIFLAFVWLITDFLNEKYNKRMRKEVEGGRQWQKERAEEMVELGSQKKGKSVLSATSDALSFATNWINRLKFWRLSKVLSAKLNHKNMFLSLLHYLIFMAVEFVNMYAVLYFSPKRYGGTRDAMYVFDGLIDPDFGTIYDITMFTILGFEVLFFLGGVIFVCWPEKNPDRVDPFQEEGTTQTRIMHRRIRSSSTESEASDIQMGLIPNTALLIATHDSCLTPERASVFKQTLKGAAKCFPLNAIFVCDNGRGLTPSDGTEDACAEVSSSVEGQVGKINYVFIPEGNKSHAFYWVNDYWIPKLVREEKCPDFEFALLIDDDVPLPSDLHVPLAMLKQNPHVQGVSYAISGATESGVFNRLVDLQGAEYKIMGLMKQLQSKLGSALYCHGAIGLWRREILSKRVLWDHDTVFDGEDLYMGLMLHKMHKNYSIVVQKGTVVPTYAPEDMLTLLRQRTRSWDLCSQRKFFTYFLELFNWGGHRVLVLKPFLLYELLTIIMDWMRPYLIFGLAHQNPGGLILLFLIFYIILWLEIVAYNFVILRKREDLRLSFKTAFLFPFYRSLSMAFRIVALMVNVMFYPLYFQPHRISKREKSIGDIPPVPPQSLDNIDWFSVWTRDKENQDEMLSEAMKLRRKGLVSERDALRKEQIEQSRDVLKGVTQRWSTSSFERVADFLSNLDHALCAATDDWGTNAIPRKWPPKDSESREILVPAFTGLETDQKGRLRGDLVSFQASLDLVDLPAKHDRCVYCRDAVNRAIDLLSDS